MGAVAAVVIAVVVLVSIGSGREHPRRQNSRRPEAAEGVTCSDLADAAGHFEAGRLQEFAQAVRTAGDVAFDALEISGQRFGRSERVAIRLQNVLDDRGPQSLGITRLLEQAADVCTQLGLWAPAEAD